jgi:hypothetical protein
MESPERETGEGPGHEIPRDALDARLERHRRWLETAGDEGRRADLAGAILQRASLWRADLRNADLRRADLSGANLDHANAAGALLEGADLTGASLWEANLRGANLAGGRLCGAKLDHADLRGATLQRADLRGVSLWGAHLEGANLAEVVGLTQDQLRPAAINADTVLPDLREESVGRTTRRHPGGDQSDCRDRNRP